LVEDFMSGIAKAVTKKKLSDLKNDKSDLEYWLSKTDQERMEAMEKLRKQYGGSDQRLQRVVRVIKRKKS
jgi:protein tyrosine/serine phosphatase